jgi:Ca2+-binding EF-hand superfamily protein
MSRPVKSARITVVALAAVLLGTPVVQAQVRGNFDDADTNHDGHVTLQEYETYTTNRLMQANGPRAQQFKQLSPDEQAARLQRRFNKLDKGQKGYLDRNDWNGS